VYLGSPSIRPSLSPLFNFYTFSFEPFGFRTGNARPGMHDKVGEAVVFQAPVALFFFFSLMVALGQ
jgi:hypothetical protein